MTTIDEIENGGNNRLGRAGASRGMALISTLLIMSLMIAMTLAMTIAMSSDMLITRYYRNFRSAFYAADSGTNIVRQYMANQIVAAIPTTFSNTTQPIPAGTSTTVQSSILTNYGSTASAANLNIIGGGAAGSWPGKFYIASSPAPTLVAASPGCTVSNVGPNAGTGTVSAGPYDCTTNVPVCTGTCTGFGLTYQYQYNYSLTSIGQSTASEQAQVQDVGQINIHVNVAPAGGTTTSFAAWGMFIDQFAICSSDLVGGTMSGPVFTNGAWTYGTTSVGYTYTDTVGSVSPNFGYDFGSTCDQKSTASDKVGGTTIAPNFQSGYKLGQTALPLPSDSYDQKRAVLDGLGTNDTDPTQAQMGAALRKRRHDRVSIDWQLLPQHRRLHGRTRVDRRSGGSTVNQMQGGGIYVAGNADSVDADGEQCVGRRQSCSGHGQWRFAASCYDQAGQHDHDRISRPDEQHDVHENRVHGHGHRRWPAAEFKAVTTSESVAQTMVYVDGNLGTSSSTGLSGPGQGRGGDPERGGSDGVGQREHQHHRRLALQNSTDQHTRRHDRGAEQLELRGSGHLHLERQHQPLQSAKQWQSGNRRFPGGAGERQHLRPGEPGQCHRHADDRGRPHPELDPKYQYHDAQRMVRPAIFARRLCAAVVPVDDDHPCGDGQRQWGHHDVRPNVMAGAEPVEFSASGFCAGGRCEIIQPHPPRRAGCPERLRSPPIGAACLLRGRSVIFAGSK